MRGDAGQDKQVSKLSTALISLPLSGLLWYRQNNRIWSWNDAKAHM